MLFTSPQIIRPIQVRHHSPAIYSNQIKTPQIPTIPNRLQVGRNEKKSIPNRASFMKKNRSAETGEYVSSEYAKQHPATTVIENSTPHSEKQCNENVLHITLTRKWFKMIADGVKTEDYREIKPFWNSRIVEVEIVTKDGATWGSVRKFEKVIARNGYGKNVPEMHLTPVKIVIGTPNKDWCEKESIGQKMFVIRFKKVEIIRPLINKES